MTLKASLYNFGVCLDSVEITHNVISGASVCATLTDLEKMAALDGSLPEDLVRNGFLVDSDVSESDLTLMFWEAARWDRSRSYIAIAPTLLCNFECVYCYAPSTHKAMDKRVADQVIAFIRRILQSGSRVQISWLGGEPLLQIDVIIYMMDQLRNRISTDLTSEIVTNGSLLTYPVATKLQTSGIRTAIVSVDGPEDVQMTRRRWRGGHNSYERVLNNISEVINVLDVVLRINADGSSVSRIPELLSDLRQRGMLDRLRISVAVTQSFNAKCAAFYGHCIAGGEELSSILAMCEELGLYGTWGGPSPSLGVCPAVRVNDFGIGPEGELYKCVVDLGYSDSAVGHVNGGPINVNMLKWMLYRPLLKDGCKECRYLPLCVGWCPRLLKNLDPPGYLHCEPMRSLHSALIRYHLKGKLR